MAIDAKKTKIEKSTESAEVAVSDGNKKKKLLLIIGLVVALIAVSIGGTVVALKMLTPGSEEIDEEVTESPPLAPAIYLPLAPNFTINFNVNGRQRYLQAEITLMYRDPSLDELIKLHLPAIRNGLVMLLSSKNFDELQTPEGKEKLREESLHIVQNLLKKEQEALTASQAKDTDEDEDEEESDAEDPPLPNPMVEQILFTNFVVQ